MKSHSYHFAAKDAFDICFRPLPFVLIVAICLHLANHFDKLPSPHPTLDVDRTIMLHQLDAARRPQEASIVFIGDSSCLMGIDTVAVSKGLNKPALNLGTLSFLDLSHYARLLEEYFKHNSNRVEAVVLLCHPEALRRHGPKPYYAEFFDHALADQDFIKVDHPYEYVLRLFGLDLVRDRIEPRVLPTTLPGEFGTFYGFSTDLYRYMSEHQGCAIEPGHKAFRGDGRYYLAAHQEDVSERFHEAIPAGVKLIIGISPSPRSFLANAYPQAFDQMLEQWKTWTGADAALRDLPMVFPDHLCASVTHLTAQGRVDYTQAMIEQLRLILPTLK